MSKDKKLDNIKLALGKGGSANELVCFDNLNVWYRGAKRVSIIRLSTRQKLTPVSKEEYNAFA